MTPAPAVSSPVASPLLASAAAAPAGGATDREKLSAVAKQFEAIFLRQMLSSARSTNFGESLFSDSQAMGTFEQMRDERFADIASDKGAFGLAKMIEAHLARNLPPATDTAAAEAEGANHVI